MAVGGLTCNRSTWGSDPVGGRGGGRRRRRIRGYLVADGRASTAAGSGRDAELTFVAEAVDGEGPPHGEERQEGTEALTAAGAGAAKRS